jgi:hypothetical protein
LVLFCLNFGRSLANINDMNIVLIPKKKVSNRVIDFWSISLCNVIYKMVAKVLANRIKHILLYIISPNQRAFVARRKIIDNVIAAYEI